MPTECSVDGCQAVTYARGFCHPHYDKFHLYGDPTYEREKTAPPECRVSLCGERAASRGLCEKHYTRWKRYKSFADLEPRDCIICGEPFDPANRRSKACKKSDCVRARKIQANNGSAAKREEKERTVECAGCGTTFTTTNRQRK